MSPQILDKLSNMKIQSAIFDLYLQMGTGWDGFNTFLTGVRKELIF
jgi:hypothetical protein